MANNLGKGKKRLEVNIDEEIYNAFHRRLADPSRPDGKIKRGVASAIITALISQWLQKNRTLEEVTGETENDRSKREIS